MTTVAERTSLSSLRARFGPTLTLSPEDERDLAQRFREGDRKAGERLIAGCLPFVATIAFEYRRWGLPLEDIVQEGCIGLLKAAARFDPDRGCRLATYAAYWIRAEIREYVVRDYRIVRLGASKAERRALRLYRRTREKDPEVLAKGSGLSVQRVQTLLPLLSARETSLDRTSPEGRSAADWIASPGPSPEDEALAADERARISSSLEEVIADLGPRERAIVNGRWLTESPLTLDELGQSFGVSKERVRQLEERARRRVRERLESFS